MWRRSAVPGVRGDLRFPARGEGGLADKTALLEERADYTHVVRILRRPELVATSHWVLIYVDGAEDSAYTYNALQLRVETAVYPWAAAHDNPFFDPARYAKSLLLDLPTQTKPSEAARQNQFVDAAWRYAYTIRI